MKAERHRFAHSKRVSWSVLVYVFGSIQIFSTGIRCRNAKAQSVQTVEHKFAIGIHRFWQEDRRLSATIGRNLSRSEYACVACIYATQRNGCIQEDARRCKFVLIIVLRRIDRV